MARTRNWSARTAAEVFVRINHLEQPTQRVADAVGLTFQQVHHFKRELLANPTQLPPCNWPTTEAEFEAIRVAVVEQSAAEDKAAHDAHVERVANRRALSIDRGGPPQILTAELDAEIGGCIDLVRQAAAQFGMTPRKFLWLCSTDARSA
jgi:hypothetical protein